MEWCCGHCKRFVLRRWKTIYVQLIGTITCFVFVYFVMYFFFKILNKIVPLATNQKTKLMALIFLKQEFMVMLTKNVYNFITAYFRGSLKLPEISFNILHAQNDCIRVNDAGSLFY